MKYFWLLFVLGCDSTEALQGEKGDTGKQGLQGDQGPQGEKGDTGPQGEQGFPGATGAQGPMGPQGPAGAPGNDGAPGAQGSQGPMGAQGPKGDVGPMGPAGGGITKDSVYEVASTLVVGAQPWDTSAQCADANDVLLHGTCTCTGCSNTQQGLSLNVTDNSQAAKWTCRFTAASGNGVTMTRAVCLDVP